MIDDNTIEKALNYFYNSEYEIIIKAKYKGFGGLHVIFDIRKDGFYSSNIEKLIKVNEIDKYIKRMRNNKISKLI